MLEVKVPKDINEYKEKIVFGLSLRQMICFGLALILCVGTYILLTSVFNMDMDLVSYIIMIEALPLFAVGFIRKNGMPFEKYFALWLRHRFGKNKFVYKTELDIDKFEKERSGLNGNLTWLFEEDRTPVSRRKRRENDKLREASPEFVPSAGQRKQSIAAARRSIKKALRSERNEN